MTGPAARLPRECSPAGCDRASRSDRPRCLTGSAGPTPRMPRGRATRRRRPAVRVPAARTNAAPTAAARSRRRACRWPRPQQRAAARCGPEPGPTRPGRSSRCPRWPRRTAKHSAPLRAASPASTHGSKSAGARFGKVSIRLPRSPLGSMQIAGTPSIAASSSNDRHRPVLPEPVMPTHTACVVRSFES